jgi:hypothetical protein
MRIFCALLLRTKKVAREAAFSLWAQRRSFSLHVFFGLVALLIFLWLASDLTYVGDRLTRDNIIIRIVNGGDNMPAFGSSLKPQEIDALVAFLESRKRPIRPQDQSPIAQN